MLAFLCFNRGIEVLGPNRGGLFLLALVFLGEGLQAFHAAGIALAATAKKARS